ncbi:MAG TPA: hypothetical protein EYN59_07330, partial [Candidatus Marinimicrobia bacterium]|nr:hypothetical protein [Candidatus Neomarinimicrobiota bacterium]
MSWWIWLVAAVLVFFAITAGKILRTTEVHGQETSGETTSPFGFRHSIFSFIFYPIGFFTFVFTVLTLTPLIFVFHPKRVHWAIRFYGRLML